MTQPLRILLIEDDEDDFVLTQEALSEGMQIPYALRWVSSFEAGLQAYRDEPPDVCLLDFRLGAHTGLDFLHRVRHQPAQCPVILLTGQGGMDTDRAAMAAGAADYLDKNTLNGILLERTIRYSLERYRHQQAHRLAQLVFKHTSEGIIVTDTAFNILSANPKAQNLLVEDQQVLVGRPLEECLPGQGLPFFRSDIVCRLREAGLWSGELELRAASGKEIPVLINANGIANELGAVDHYAFLMTDLAQAREAQAAIHFLSFHDSLTGLPNVRHLRLHLAHLLNQQSGEPPNLCLLNFSIGRLEALNAVLGWEVVNQLILQVVQRLGRLVPKDSFLARTSGQEFMLVSPCSEGRQGCKALASRLMAAMESPITLAGVEARASLAIGITRYPEDTSDCDELLSHASAALNEARQRHGQQLVDFAEIDYLGAKRAIRLDGELHKALERNELELYYQPKVNLDSGQICGAEALIRWRHPEEGLLSPLEFIPLAERSGLILRIGEWVIHRAVRQMQSWQQQGLPSVPVSVNVSSRQFAGKDLADIVTTALAQYGIAPALLELELTESMLLTLSPSNRAQLDQLKQLGITLSLDDFGTGYSSFSQLHQLPIDVLKIDRSFVTDVYREPDRAKIISSIIHLARELGVEVVAEGVETLEEALYLRQKQCQTIQGYLFSRPLPAAEFAALLDSGMTLTDLPPPEPAGNLLIVDDDAHVIASLERLLRRQPYQLLTSTDPNQALDLLARHPVQVVLCDLRMPGMSGTEFLNQVSAIYPDVVKSVISGYTHFDAIVDVVNRGDIFKFVTKPWDDDRLKQHIQDCFDYYRVRNRQGVD